MKSFLFFTTAFLLVCNLPTTALLGQCDPVAFSDLTEVETRYLYDPLNYFADCRVWETEFVSGGIFYCGAWEEEFYDGFDGSELDTQWWTSYYPDERPLFQRLTIGEASHSILHDKNVKVSDGLLTLTAQSDPGISWEGITKNYSSALIHGNLDYAFHMGRYEIRCKLPTTTYSSAAFWMWNGDEIDVLDSGNKDWYTNQMISRDWYPGQAKHGGIRNTVKNEPEYVGLSERFHTYSMDWDPFSITFYLDDCPTAKYYKYYTEEGEALQVECGEMIPEGRYRVNPSFTKRQVWFRPILNMNVNANAPRPPTTFAHHLEVDYVRISERTFDKISLQRSTDNSREPNCASHTELGQTLWVHFNQELLNFFKLDSLVLDYGYVPDFQIFNWTHSSNIEILDQTADALQVHLSGDLSDSTSNTPPYWVKVFFSIENGPVMEWKQIFSTTPAPEIHSCKVECEDLRKIGISTLYHCLEDLDIRFALPDGEVIQAERLEENDDQVYYYFKLSTGCIHTTISYQNDSSLQSLEETHCFPELQSPHIIPSRNPYCDAIIDLEDSANSPNANWTWNWTLLDSDDYFVEPRNPGEIRASFNTGDELCFEVKIQDECEQTIASDEPVCYLVPPFFYNDGPRYELKASPNPFVDYLSIELSDLESDQALDGQLIIANQLGAIVFSKAIYSSKVNLTYSELSQQGGIYFMQFQASNGSSNTVEVIRR